MPTSFSEMDLLLTASADIGPIPPHTITCGVQNTENVALKYMSSAPLESLANILRRDDRKASAPNCSARTMTPPVWSTAVFISASPTWSSEHANTSSVCACVASRMPIWL